MRLCYEEELKGIEMFNWLKNKSFFKSAKKKAIRAGREMVQKTSKKCTDVHFVVLYTLNLWGIPSCVSGNVLYEALHIPI